MAGPLYSIDPVSGETTATFEGGFVVPSSASEAFGRPVRVQNGVVFDATTGRIYTNLGTGDVTTVTRLQNGLLDVWTPTGLASLNQPVGTGVYRSVVGEVNVIAADGNAYTIEIGGASAAKAGTQLAYQMDAEGDLVLTKLPGAFSTNAEVEAVLGAGSRLLTPGELMDRAIQGHLLSGHLSELQEIAAAGGVVGETGTDTVSGLVRFLAANPPRVDLQAYTRRLL